MKDTVDSHRAVQIAARLFERLGPAPSLFHLVEGRAGGMGRPDVRAWPTMWHCETLSLNTCTEERADELARTTPLGLA